MSDDLTKAIDALKAANDVIISILKKEYPTGTQWAVQTRHGQVNPTYAVVTGHEGGRYADVCFASIKWRKLRRLTPRNILYQIDL